MQVTEYITHVPCMESLFARLENLGKCVLTSPFQSDVLQVFLERHLQTLWLSCPVLLVPYNGTRV